MSKVASFPVTIIPRHIAPLGFYLAFAERIVFVSFRTRN